MPISSGEDNSSRRASRVFKGPPKFRSSGKRRRTKLPHEIKAPETENIALFKLSHRHQRQVEDRSTLKLDSLAIRKFKKSLIDIKNLKQLFDSLKNLSSPKPRSFNDLENLLTAPYSKDQPLKDKLTNILEEVYFKNTNVKNAVALMKTLGLNPFRASSHIKNKIKLAPKVYFTLDNLYALFSKASSETIERLDKLSSVYTIEEERNSYSKNPHADKHKVTTATMTTVQDFGPLESLKSKLELAEKLDPSSVSRVEINKLLALSTIMMFKVKSTKLIYKFLSLANKIDDPFEALDFISSKLNKYQKIILA